MTKIDPYKHKERYIQWKKESKNGISEKANGVYFEGVMPKR